jgi:helicase
VDLCDWLLYSASEIGKIFDLKDARKTIAMLRARVSYGVREELLELVSLRGIGRVRARNLYNSGFRKLGDIREAEARQLEGIPGIGKSIARDIKRQASGSA